MVKIKQNINNQGHGGMVEAVVPPYTLQEQKEWGFYSKWKRTKDDPPWWKFW